MIRVVIYIRVSTQEQANEGYSIGEQTARLGKYCEAMGWTVVKTYTDGGFSGADTDRPALKQLISAVKDGKIDKVVVYKLDRLSRSQKDTLLLIEDIFLANNTDFVSMQENFDTSTPFGRAMIGILAVFAQLEREQIKERMTMGKDARAKEGKWKGGQPPTGYDYIDGELIVKDFIAMQIREIFDLFIKGTPVRRIATIFYNKGYSDEHMWTAKKIRYALENKTYLGYIRYHDEYFKGTHESIIDEDIFETAQRMLADRRIAFEKSNTKASSIKQTTHLGGLLFCKHCGGRFSKNHVKTGKSTLYYTYACYSRHKRVRAMIKDPNCKNKVYTIEDLDEIIFSEIRMLQTDPDYIFKVAEEKNDNQHEVAVIEAELKTIDNQISRFMDLYGIGRFTIDELDDKVNPLRERRDNLDNTLSNLVDCPQRLSTDEAIHFINSFADALENGNLHVRRAIINSLIERIEIDNEIIDIHWRFV